MFAKSAIVAASFAALAAAAPAPVPQVSGYTNANAGFSSVPAPVTTTATVFGPDSQVPYTPTMAPNGTMSGAAPTRISPNPTGPTSHGPFNGTATVTGAVSASVLAASVGTLPLNPTATYYNTDGKLQKPMPAPYTPAGGLGTNGSLPRYMVESDFDFESIALGLYQEWIELDLFNNGLAVFSAADFEAEGLTAEDRAYIAFMATQETGHATLLTNLLGPRAPKQCTYNYPFTTVREFIDFNQKLTRFGESGVLGFQAHLDSREVGQLLMQSITTESRQQMSFRQMLGLAPQPVWFENGIPQSWSWSLLAPYISSCPENNTRLAWQNMPVLHILNQPNPNRFSPNDTGISEVTGNRASDPSISTIPQNASCVHVNVTGYDCSPAIARNRSEPLSFAGKRVDFMWDAPGKAVGPNNSYLTSTTAGMPKFVGWSSQLNFTYTPLTVTGNNTGYTFQPAGEVYQGDPAVNGTMFVVLTDEDLYVTAFNLSMVNPHVVALGLYQAG